MKRLRVVLLANWGLGLEALRVLDDLAWATVTTVITDYDQASSDPWRNCVQECAAQLGYPVLVEKGLSQAQIRKEIIFRGADLLVAHAYMKILRRETYTASTFGGINIHPSLLPRHRGPSPTYWVLRNKEPETGLTCHYIDDGIDTGEIISQASIPVTPHDTLNSIIEKQKRALRTVLPQALDRVKDPTFVPRSQDNNQASYAPRPDNIEESRYAPFRDFGPVQLRIDQ